MSSREVPSLSSLPSLQQLWRSTFVVLIVAALTLLTIILPAEYAIDPTGVGRMLGLTTMGEIKRQIETESTRRL